MKLARKLGKIAALVGSFVGNRMFSRLLLQAQHLLLEGSTPWEVDRVLYDFGFPLGPFALADHVGLDIGWLRELPHSPGIHESLCERDRCGLKTNAGFYDYEADGRAQPSKQVEALIVEMARSKGGRRRSIGAEEILERCVYPMVNEGARILEAGKAIRASDIDIVGIHGLGWPAYRGGPMYFGDLAGLDVVLRKLRHLESQLGEELRPAALLERLVAQGAKFRDL
jgi:3-hydroxyacyl-CoA dehydrogenase